MASAELSPYLRGFRCLSAAEEEIALNHETIRNSSKKEAKILWRRVVFRVCRTNGDEVEVLAPSRTGET
jgi:hypothetical protein